MRNRKWRKGLVLEILLLLFFTSIIPSISGIDVENTVHNDKGIIDQTLYPPWELWDNMRDITLGLGGWESGYEYGNNENVSVITNIGAGILGASYAIQNCWNNVTWTCPQNDYYRFAFDYDSHGWGVLTGGSYWGDAAVIDVTVFYIIIDPDYGPDGPYPFNYTRVIFTQSGWPPFEPTWFGYNEHSYAQSPTIYAEAGKTYTIMSGISVESFCLAILGFSSVEGELHGQENYIYITNEPPTTPLLHIDPNPPNHNFGVVTEGERRNWSFNVWNGGIGTLHWTIHKDSNWFIVIPPFGFSNGQTIQHKVIINTTGLNPGYHSGHIEIDSDMGSINGLIEVFVNSQIGPPLIPSGTTEGETWKSYSYTTSVNDPDEHDVYYWFDWGDGSNTSWIGPYTSGQEISITHTWDSPGNFNVKVKAKDIYGATSDWSEPLQVNIIEEPVQVSIIQPKNGIYVLGSLFIPLFFSKIIIGPIEIEVDASSHYGIQRCEFYVNNGLRETDYTYPYSFIWTESLSYESFTLTVNAYDTIGRMTSKTLENVWKFSFGPG
jgi:hypothetical protein